MTAVNFQLRMSQQLLDRLNERCSRRGIRTSEYIRVLLAEAVDHSDNSGPGVSAEAKEVADAR
jgi:metal-responsive CopG/Arc/MetJ family transcriptional regulator